MNYWITGASSGLGRELALQLAAAGHVVCVSARGEQSLAELAAEVSGSGAIHPYACDVGDMAAVQQCFAAICAAHGLPDVCVLNAGTHTPNSAARFDRAVFQRLMDINSMGTVNCLQAIVPAYLGAGAGRIAVVSSVAGYRGLPNASAYGATKAALINMCEALRPELAAAGVVLQVVNPGFVRTPLTDKNDFPMPFLMEVEDAAAQLVRGLSSDRFEITFPKRFTWLLKLLRMLPYAIYLGISARTLRND